MEEMQKMVEREEKLGTKFCWKDPYSNYRAEIEVDSTGKPTYAFYGSDRGWCSKCYSEIGFDSVVQMVMKNFLDHDIDHFNKMRRILNEEYFEMAERLRRKATSRNDF